jgi:hypothetical protein
VTGDNPFAALDLPVRPDLSDDEVRAAWRRIAAATHPDLPDGGDESRFAAAAAAYAQLRTSYGRGEAYADLRGVPGGSVAGGTRGAVAGGTRGAVAGGTATATATAVAGPGPATAAGPGPAAARALSPAIARLVWRVRRGRPAILTLRVVIATAVSLTSVALAGWQPATLAIVVGSLTWLLRTTRYDLAPPPA